MRAVRAFAALLGIGVMAFAALPAEAQLMRRHNDGTVTIDPILCFNDYQVRQAVAAQGFANIKLNQALDSHQRVHATRGGHSYLIDFDICSGQIVSIQRTG